MRLGAMQRSKAMGVLRLLLACLLIPAIYLLPANGPPPSWEPIACTDGGTSNCTVTNTYGSFPDRSVCYAASATYPLTEEELVAAVAAAAAARQKAKAATRHAHSFTKLACPGGRDGTVISTRWLNRTVRVDVERRLVTVESGVVLRDLIAVAAAAGLALPHSPYWDGLTVGGLLATGAHGSSLWGKGGAVHEYVVGIRIVTPAPASQGFAVVRELGADHPDLDAAKVSLGVLGIISQVTLSLEPMFKRSVTFVTRDDSDLAEKVAVWGHLHEFGDMTWLPHQHKVVYRQDDRVDISTPGDGLNDFLGFRPFGKLGSIAARVVGVCPQIKQAKQAFDVHDASVSYLWFTKKASEVTMFYVHPIEDSDEWLEEKDVDLARCLMARLPMWKVQREAYGFTNDGVSFTGYPVVGFQHRIQASGACSISTASGDGLLPSTCAWDPRVRGQFFYSSGFSVALSKAPAFIADAQRLRDLNPRAFCGLEGKLGVFMRYVKASSAWLGKAEDSLDFDVVYYRSYRDGALRRHADVVDELEQMALRKYGAVPHWGKNRNFAFDGVVAKYPKAEEFLRVKDRYDPNGIFSSEWSDQVLGIEGSPSIVGKGCAIEGLCVCSDDSHCAPDKGYFCRPGKVYKEARVCLFDDSYARRRSGTVDEL
ncbi:L-gulonolactone oxidase 2 [Dichanthelium oligosanthes]|uniref:L-gulonolactone oxidase n=1 Tax=Dichanthelium oligosanthes TaxID=888268 RepID=A0A1E5VVN1_9POAL|nr:L-gulonolactone oxidase 2 [Dichanthelium oligosanthes]